MIGTFPEVRQIIEEAVEKSLQNDMTPEEAMEEAAAKVDKSLEQYNSLYK
jgi:sn-glycerol 3-phosphate transport system substrate-binding protein